MKRYIKITNKGTTPRDFLKIIGAGGKDKSADNDSIFGQFKSGYKIASVIALRRGLAVVASSTDDEGKYSLTYTIRPKTIKHNSKEIVISKIGYWHFDGKKEWIEDSSFALDAFPKWVEAVGDDGNKIYPILRELIANARDEDKDFQCEIGIERLLMAPPGQTVVYMEETNDALRALGIEADRYFKFFGVCPLFEAPGIGEIYPKSVPGETRIFCNGYLVGCRRHDALFQTSRFDYNVYGHDFLSEDKTLRDKDMGEYGNRLAQVVLSIRDKDLLLQIIEACADTAAYELEIIRRVNAVPGLPSEFMALCLEIWLEKYGSKAILASDNSNHNMEAKTVLQHDVIPLSHSLKEFFKKAGIEDARQKMSVFNRGLTDRPPTPGEQEKIKRVKVTYLEGHLYYRDLAEKYPVTVLLDKSGAANAAALDYNRCAITEKKFVESDSEFLFALIHELRHCATKIHDTDYRELMGRADWEIVWLLHNAAIDKSEINVLNNRIKELEERVNKK